MKIIKLPCTIGDKIYYVTEWDKYGFQEDHQVEINEITITKDEVIFHTEHTNFLLSRYNKYWFTDEKKWLKECKILRETYKHYQHLRNEINI